jgi:DNA-binding NarL/FixJ family response regulator
MQLSLDEFCTVTAAIHAAAAHPERWPEAFSAVAQLLKQTRDPSWRNVLASLDRLGVSAFIVTGAGAVLHANARAKALIDRDVSVRIAAARLRFADAALNAALDAALQRAAGVSPHSSLFPLRSSTNDVYEVNVSPFEVTHDEMRMPPLALVLIARPRPSAEHISRRVRRLYGLTEAEARVMAAITLGEKVEQIAHAHGVRTSTVRAQVRSIFEKTGVHRQSDLVRLALSAAPLFSARD